MTRHLFHYIYIVALAALATGCSSDDWPSSPVINDMSSDSAAIHPTSNYMAVVGDIQTYTYNNPLMPYLKASMEWIELQHGFYGNIDFVAQTGDMTETNTTQEWNRALLAMRPVAELIPTVAVTGNHDYDWLRESGDNYADITSRESTLFNDHLLPVAPNLSIVSLFEEGRRENAIYLTLIGKRKAHIVALEFAPRPEVVEWARRHIASTPETDTYLLTHEWLDIKGQRISWNFSYARRQFHDRELAMAPEDIWQAIVKPYDNVIAVICGHNSFMQVLEDKNDAGRIVPQILFNLQYQDNGGNSMIQLWEFPDRSDSVKVRVYNTMGRYFITDSLTSYSFSRARAAK